jgi:hypothetical protein
VFILRLNAQMERVPEESYLEDWTIFVGRKEKYRVITESEYGRVDIVWIGHADGGGLDTREVHVWEGQPISYLVEVAISSGAGPLTPGESVEITPEWVASRTAEGYL